MASLPSRAEYMPSNATFANRHFYLSHDSGHALDTSHVHAALALHAVLVIVCPIHWFLQPKSRLHGLVLTRWEPPSHLFPPRTLKRLPPTDDALDHLGFDSFSSAPAPAPVRTASKSPQPASALDDDWEFGDFTFQPAAAPPRSTKATPISDLLRFDNFVPASSSQQSSSPAPPLSDTPGDFDFGDRGDGLLGDQSDGDDNLGDLGKQIEQLTAARAAPPLPPHNPSNASLKAASPSVSSVSFNWEIYAHKRAPGPSKLPQHPSKPPASAHAHLLATHSFWL
ncbi:hypothetical protein L226DRAFT_573408 [Lentinus tigrinus ALCF2SS1-7]|uniref:uncharacterized protein n=1 Tax=Lentinus tigrinus ALCF2SS1-7 TaxID=1328758 RepID=UPI001165F869|nr:hypothetical protein L226DRAFT_573408 [Lentinus tigrinus ALCF2SS1-7]